MSSASAIDAYEAFLGSQAGVYCGGAAVFLDRVLKLFGLPSAVVDFGIAGTDLTHVSVVIADDRRDEPRFYFVDPTFGATFERIDGGDASIGRLVRAVRAHNFAGGLRLRERDVAQRDWIALREKDAPMPACPVVREIGLELVVCRLPTFNFRHYVDSNAAVLQKYSIPRNEQTFVHLFTRGVFSVGDFGNPRIAKAFSRLLRTLNIRVAP